MPFNFQEQQNELQTFITTQRDRQRRQRRIFNPLKEVLSFDTTSRIKEEAERIQSEAIKDGLRYFLNTKLLSRRQLPSITVYSTEEFKVFIKEEMLPEERRPILKAALGFDHSQKEQIEEWDIGTLLELRENIVREVLVEFTNAGWDNSFVDPYSVDILLEPRNQETIENEFFERSEE